MEKFTRYALMATVVIIFAFQMNGWAQLLQWNTYGNAGTETTEPSVYNDPNISATNLTQGTITAAANSNRFGGSGWFNTGNTAAGNTLAEAIAGNDYIQFIVTPNSGFSFTPTSFVFQWDKSGTGPKNVALRSSYDGYATDLGVLAPAANLGTANTITISGLTGITTATTFRIYGYGATATGGTGGFDVGSNVVNVQLNGTTASLSAPSWTSGFPKADTPTPSGFTARVSISAIGTSYFVVLPAGSAAPSSAQVKAGQDASGASVPSGMAGTIACPLASTEYTASVTGLSSATTYDVYFVAEASSILQTSPVMKQITTNSSASAPTVSSPTYSTITNNSALLGGNVSSDGGSAITERGTLWKAAAGVTISDNQLAEGGTTTGIFTHTRTSLPAKSQIYFKAYAINSIGTTLSTESSFFTLADEPSTHAGSFSAIATGITSINLSWTAATGADGYLILKKQGSSAPTGSPADATGYTVGNTIGDATLAADILSGSTISQTITGLSGGTQYYFTIVPYAYDGLNYQTYNYNTTVTIPSATATTLENSVLWDGGASTTAWSDAANWNGDVVPGASDLVVLDNSLVSGTYSVILPSGAVKTSIKRLTISPATGNTITLTLPSTNTYGASGDGGFVVGDNTAATDDIIINTGGILINASGASAGNGIQTNNTTNGTCRINNGGKYSHSTGRSSSGIVPVLSIVAGTETGIFEYDAPGTSAYNITASGRTYGSLMLTRTAGASTYAASGGSALTVRGAFVMNSGITYSSTMTGDLLIGGDFQNNGVAFTTSTQAVKFNGTSLQTISGTGSASFLGTFTVNNAAGVNLNNALTVSNLTVTSGTFTIADNASLITTGTVSGNTTVERFITKYNAVADEMYHFISSPVSAQAINPSFSDPAGNNTDDFFKFDENTYYWINFRDNVGNGINPSFGESTLLPGRGYLYAIAADATKTFTGTLNTGTLSSTGGGLPALTYTSSLGTANAGWNLMGNPYPSAIDWDNVTAGQLTNVDNAVYVYDNANASYKSYVAGTGDLTDGIIPVAQGFFVHANDDSPSMYLENQDRVHSSVSFYKNEPVTNLVKLRVEGNNHYDATYIRFSEDATTAFDGAFDAYKLFGNSAVPAFYSVAGTTRLSVNSLPMTSLEGFVHLALKAGAEASYMLSLDENTLPAATYVTLEDLKTGVQQRLNDKPSYAFTASPSDDPNRFKLHFKDATSVPEPAKSLFIVYTEDNRIVVKSDVQGIVRISDISGRLLTSGNISSDGFNAQAQSGVYLVSLSTAGGLLTQKVIVK